MSDSSTGQVAGRTYFDNLDGAMRSCRVPVEAQATVRQTLVGISYDELWVPTSKPYIAAAREGRVVAWVHKRHIGIPGSARVELPNYRERSTGPRDARTQCEPQQCPVHHMELSATGVCPSCED